MAKKFLIENWMTADLGLSGNELVAFAFMWSESRQGVDEYDGGYTELAAAMGVTIPTTYNVLRKLADKGMVEFGGVRDGIRVIGRRVA